MDVLRTKNIRHFAFTVAVIVTVSAARHLKEDKIDKNTPKIKLKQMYSEIKRTSLSPRVRCHTVNIPPGNKYSKLCLLEINVDEHEAYIN